MTRLAIGKAVKRVVPSAHHDARKVGELVVRLTGTGTGALLEIRVARHRKWYVLPIDYIYTMAVSREAELLRRKKAAERKAKREQAAYERRLRKK